ncbi:3,4-dihydroxy-2-butanone-4-phosphate synthase [Buchnera aphidicola (Thelaxes californica)]|uniref:3,4-dihydroxy-2-butanone 4-phosphate synthase n=1 Tax=Buchnera aphidicola (Thelaxes californica) TaxID=1315998 RepID=A0A4D6Y9D7_9GAMM|nr:3,4-dihydroxy-2-butanone-4-phosphate synthase [Buchnera aphidicola]QCI26606.1 3,4-dihydroxy-2-butanone-4-phosphate synthase [Buchnera aphidicola (Thelaxes californica)]
MKKKLKTIFGCPHQRIKNAIYAIQSGKGVILLDDEKRENEGDLVFAAETMTVEQMALTIRHGSGIVCLCITESKRNQLELPMMVTNNTSAYQTPFTISIEAKNGVTTGVSAQDRITTILTASSINAQPQDLNRPGHIFPLCAHKKGILGRPGHTEGSITLVQLAGFQPLSVICELTNPNGSMAKTEEVIYFAIKNNMQVLTINDLILYLL